MLPCMRRVTRASAALAAHFETHRAQKLCAEATGISQSRLSRLASADVFPRADESVLIERATGVLATWWAEEATDAVA